jgi:hypothetical protein
MIIHGPKIIFIMLDKIQHELDANSAARCERREIKTACTRSYVAYSIQNFVADCGGLIGLFLGFSLLSIFELVCNLITFGMRKWKEQRQR